jgi:hypothetical protein
MSLLLIVGIWLGYEEPDCSASMILVTGLEIMDN